MNSKINLSFAGVLNFPRFAQRILIVLVLLVVTCAAANVNVEAQTVSETAAQQNAPGSETMLDPVPGGPGFIMVSVFAFKPYYNQPNSQAYSVTVLYNPSTTETTDSVAAITLPHGATITKLTLYFEDKSEYDATLYLARAGGQGSSETLTSFATTGSQSGFRSLSNPGTISYPIVDNQNYSYLVGIFIPKNVLRDIGISNVRIDYEYSVYTPAIMR